MPRTAKRSADTTQILKSALRQSLTNLLASSTSGPARNDDPLSFSPAARRSLLKLANRCQDVHPCEEILRAAQSSFAVLAHLLPYRELTGHPLDDSPLFFARLLGGGAFADLGVDHFAAALQASGDLTDVPADRWARPLVDAVNSSPSPISPGALQQAYLAFIPRSVRHRLGEYYTPPWLAQYTLSAAGYRGEVESRLLDPCCGAGVFLTTAIQQLRKQCAHEGLSPADTAAAILGQIVGIDVNPLAVLSAQANYLLAISDLLPEAMLPVKLPIDCADAIVGSPPDIGPPESFDFVVGNPPWVGWETLSPEYRRRTRPLWQQYGLFPHGGMDTILGRGKKDLSMLMSYAVTDRWLRPNGRLAFLITQSVFKSAGAGQGFRRFELGENGVPLCVERVDDFSALQVFNGASTKTALLVWTKDAYTRYPLPYRLWQPTDGVDLDEATSLRRVKQSTKALPFSARPIDWVDFTSPWLTGRRDVLRALEALFKPSEYIAREGVNTGGANGVFWLEAAGQDGNLTARSVSKAIWIDNTKLSTPSLTLRAAIEVVNLHDAGRNEVPRIQTKVETELLYPILRGREVRRWQATPTSLVLLAQDVQTRRGIDLETMRRRYPLALAYLQQFESHLRGRAALKRYFTREKQGEARETGPFYSMFNVGPYTLAPFKVVWHRMVTPLEAAVVEPLAGRPVLPQETHAFVPCDSADEAYYLAGLLNSTPLQLAAASYSQIGGKGFASPHLLKHLHLPTFDPSDAKHKALAKLARALQSEWIELNAAAKARRERRLDRLADDVWGLTEQQLGQIHQGWEELTRRQT